MQSVEIRNNRTSYSQKTDKNPKPRHFLSIIPTFFLTFLYILVSFSFICTKLKQFDANRTAR